ncbi:adaptin ear-binding coat-associated protein 1 NECAP-1 [Leucosporidium creatinivorum]|uniref:Adaptin ear-binding coat-associated protein 1 NECAP-1 n=1 Tax=Leucosporidium creatinivorum TaxID=106004 RepID=A0A1Y2D8F8_9BASI|nr:adaptin ear-binding coat-associated protein 1 NECAP-1 [Leucosporidium creatinivorum]
MDDAYESVLFVARECYVYRIPPRTSAEGYRAASWGDMGQPLWRGRLRVLEKGSDVPSKCFIRLEDANTGELFALTPYQPSKSNTNGGVEAVLDSSRYFVLTVVDQESGQKAYLGMGFPERSESFDFNVALQDWSKRQTPAPLDTPAGPSPHLPKGPARDFSLKPGETLNIKIGGSSTKKKAAEGSLTGGAGLGAGGFLLPPPPPPAPRGSR